MAAGGKYQNVYGGGNVSRMGWWVFSPEGASRLYDPATGRFTRPDPLAEKKPMLSHYLYCGANPLTRVDPSGLDDYILDEYGYLVDRLENKYRDQISIVDENMTSKEGAIIEFEYGTFDMSNLSRNRSDSDDKASGGSKEDDYSYLTCTNAADSEKFHSFLSKNTKVEWVNAEIEMEDHSKERYMTTSHKESTEKGFRKLWNKLVDNELKPRRLVRHDHNHPSGVAIPSGLDDRERHDIGNATEFTNMSPKEPPVFRLLDWKNDKYVHYGVNSKLEDFISPTSK